MSASTKMTRRKSRGKMTSRNKILCAQISRCLSPRMPKWAPLSSRSHAGHLKATNSKVTSSLCAKVFMDALKSGDMKPSKNQKRTGHLVCFRTDAIITRSSFSYRCPDATLNMWMVGHCPSRVALKLPRALLDRRERPIVLLKTSFAFLRGRSLKFTSTFGSSQRSSNIGMESASSSRPPRTTVSPSFARAKVSLDTPGFARSKTSPKWPSRA
mmetsp:Transcript_53073/g.147746  ORF Transcript_53073/g.147746 Transcript_53073/m.147746 type:complete len:213 (-) Transcript_53073:361-999(-)